MNKTHIHSGTEGVQYGASELMCTHHPHGDFFLVPLPGIRPFSLLAIIQETFALDSAHHQGHAYESLRKNEHAQTYTKYVTGRLF